MRVEDCAMWVCEQLHMECWGEGLGTVQVEWSAQEKCVGVMSILAGNAVREFVSKDKMVVLYSRSCITAAHGHDLGASVDAIQLADEIMLRPIQPESNT
nr:hypothetical protein [Tanacetum cinerariifolium]GFA21797.1 hypothetical protein [Tanacetum cinerariifolium]